MFDYVFDYRNDNATQEQTHDGEALTELDGFCKGNHKDGNNLHCIRTKIFKWSYDISQHLRTWPGGLSYITQSQGGLFGFLILVDSNKNQVQHSHCAIPFHTANMSSYNSQQQQSYASSNQGSCYITNEAGTCYVAEFPAGSLPSLLSSLFSGYKLAQCAEALGGSLFDANAAAEVDFDNVIHHMVNHPDLKNQETRAALDSLVHQVIAKIKPYLDRGDEVPYDLYDRFLLLVKAIKRSYKGEETPRLRTYWTGLYWAAGTVEHDH